MRHRATCSPSKCHRVAKPPATRAGPKPSEMHTFCMSRYAARYALLHGWTLGGEATQRKSILHESPTTVHLPPRYGPDAGMTDSARLSSGR
ncbi:hypothetical protein M8818_000073 [Zalaria obscura]|uniref:Uncharacterized protein n=1 Tax=Zalaria obscura TaxID=2024903 RepID=A0ACC3SPL9_9PEZI